MKNPTTQAILTRIEKDKEFFKDCLFGLLSYTYGKDKNSKLVAIMVANIADKFFHEKEKNEYLKDLILNAIKKCSDEFSKDLITTALKSYQRNNKVWRLQALLEWLRMVKRVENRQFVDGFKMKDIWRKSSLEDQMTWSEMKEALYKETSNSKYHSLIGWAVSEDDKEFDLNEKNKKADEFKINLWGSLAIFGGMIATIGIIALCIVYLGEVPLLSQLTMKFITAFPYIIPTVIIFLAGVAVKTSYDLFEDVKKSTKKNLTKKRFQESSIEAKKIEYEYKQLLDEVMEITVRNEGDKEECQMEIKIKKIDSNNNNFSSTYHTLHPSTYSAREVNKGPSWGGKKQNDDRKIKEVPKDSTKSEEKPVIHTWFDGKITSEMTIPVTNVPNCFVLLDMKNINESKEIESLTEYQLNLLLKYAKEDPKIVSPKFDSGIVDFDPIKAKVTVDGKEYDVVMEYKVKKKDILQRIYGFSKTSDVEETKEKIKEPSKPKATLIVFWTVKDHYFQDRVKPGFSIPSLDAASLRAEYGVELEEKETTTSFTF